MSRRRARFRSIYVNGVPVWECNRCGTHRLPATRHEELAAHERTCGQPKRQDGAQTEETDRA